MDESRCGFGLAAGAALAVGMVLAGACGPKPAPYVPPTTPTTFPEAPIVAYYVNEVMSVAADEEPNRVAIDATHVYWLSAGAIKRTPKAGGSVETLADGLGVLGELTIDADSVYAVSEGTGYDGTTVGGGALYRVPKTGGAATTLATGVISPTPLVVDATHVYFGYATDPISMDSPTATLFRVPKAGGDSETLAGGQSTPKALAVDDRFLYWANLAGGNHLRRVPKGGGDIETLSDQLESPTGLYLLDDGLLVADGLLGIVRVPGDGGTPVVVYPFEANASAVHGEYVYWQHEDGLFAAPIAGGGRVRLLTDEESYGFDVLAADDEYVYWSYDGEASVRKVPTSGGLLVVGNVAAKPGDVVADDTGVYYIDWDDGAYGDTLRPGIPDRVVHVNADGTESSMADSATDTAQHEDGFAPNFPGSDAELIALNADADHLYYGDPGRNLVFALPKSGGKPTVIADGTPIALAVAHTDVVWIEASTGDLRSVPKTGGSALTRLANAAFIDNEFPMPTLAADADGIYFTVPARGEVRRLRTGDSAAALVSSGQQAPSHIVVTLDKLYWASGNKVMMAPRLGDGVYEVATLDMTIELLAVHGSTVYAVVAPDGGGDHELRAIDANGVSTTLRVERNHIGDIAPTSDGIYWSSREHNAILFSSRPR